MRVLLLFFSVLTASVSGKLIASNVRREVSLGQGKYILGWSTNHDTKVITFDVTVQTTGFVGLGISPNGAMLNADFFIGGVFNNGTPYSSDRFGLVDKAEPIKDVHDDWTLLGSNQNATHTYLQFSRPLDTCDENGQDRAIKEDVTKLIWAFGSSDNIGYHSANRGAFSAYMLDEPIPPIDLSQYDNFTITNTVLMPNKDTTYWCTIHKGPQFTEKRHAIVFEQVVKSEDDINHIHHFVILRCKAPDGVDPQKFFDPYVGQPGGECYVPKEQQKVPYEQCTSFIFDWSVGGSMLVFPDDVGFPWGTELHEYFMLEIHLDNPRLTPNLNITAGATFYHIAADKRTYNAEMLVITHQMQPSLIVPPSTTNWVTVGHCSAQCTQRIPETGIKLFNVNLHAHITGKKLKLRHFRNGKELPWVMYDDNYDFNYQEMRPLRNELTLLPGDHLTMECTYDSTWKDTEPSGPGIVMGGFGSREEMCETYIYYYPRMPGVDFCLSYFDPEILYEHFGITEVSDVVGIIDPDILEPKELAGQTFGEFLNKQNWTNEMKAEFQEKLRFGNHIDSCGDYGMMSMNKGKNRMGMVKYPEYESDYVPPNDCVINVTDPPGNTNPTQPENTNPTQPESTNPTQPENTTPTSTDNSTDSSSTLTLSVRLFTFIAISKIIIF